jgi:hypothetical protein
MRKFLILALGFATLGVAGSLLLHFNPLCGEEMVMEKASPDGRYVAGLLSRNCGATTPYVAHINLRLANSRFQASFFDGTIKDGEIWGSSKYSGERFCWSGSKRLEIGYPTDDGRQPPKTWRDVTIGNDYRNPSCQ